VDHRADLYALGCVTYWLLTGRMVFEADSALKMLIQHIQAEPVPPSRRTGLPVPPALERVVMRCLEKDPGKRPATADEIVAELDRMDLDGAWDQERARGWWETSMEPPSSHLADTGPRILAVQST